MRKQLRKRETTLRQRIIEEMPNILELMDIDNSVFFDDEYDDDLWRTIIWVVRRIAELETMPQSKARRAFDGVEESVRRLKVNLNKLPPSVRSLVAIPDLDDARRQIEQVTSNTKADRKSLAASLTANLIRFYGGYDPTLYRDGDYIKLTGKLYFVATGEKANLQSDCGQYFSFLKQEGIDPYTDKRGPRRRELPDEVEAEYIEKILQQRETARRLRPPLEQVVDDALASELETLAPKSPPFG